MGTCQGRPVENTKQHDGVVSSEVVVENNINGNQPRSKDKLKSKYAKATDLLDAENDAEQVQSEDGTKQLDTKPGRQMPKKPPAKKAAATIDKRLIEEMNAMQSPIKNSSLASPKTLNNREDAEDKKSDLPRIYYDKESISAFKKILRGKDSGLKNNAQKLRKQLAQKNHKTLTSKIIYSNNNLAEIDQLLKQEIMNSTDPDQIIFEGKLLKYKPGTSFNWIERFVRVTRTELKYYKNQWTASCKDLKPLLVIPLRQLVAVFRVNLNLPETKAYNKWAKQVSSVQKKHNELYQLEIFSEQSEYPYKDECYDFQSDPQHKKQTEEEEDIQLARNIDLDQMDGYRLWNEYQDRKLNESPENARQKGYLMRPPHRYRNLRGSIVSDGIPRQSRGASVDAGLQRTSIMRGRVATQEIERTRQSIFKKLCKSPAQISQKKSSMNKKSAVYKWIKETQMMNSWSGREREWFYSEKRLLFATPSEQEREIWVSVLNWLFKYTVNEEEEQYYLEGNDQYLKNEAQNL